LLLIFGLACGFTVVRTILTNTIFLPLGKYLALTDDSVKKMPESVWKLLYYGSMTIFSFRTVFNTGSRQIFQRPSTTWDGWSLDAVIPDDIYAIQVTQIAFYFHGLYALFFQDQWRKDSVVMGVHHVMTICLLWMSFVCRFYNIAAMVLLVHDCCDVELEFAKLNVYLKVRNGQTHKINDILAGVAFFAMTVVWFVGRLYYFPLKILHSSSGVLLEKKLFPDYAMFNNLLLILLLGMNVYWFSQMLSLLYKILVGEIEELDDIREYDVAEKLERSSEKNNAKKID